MDKIIYLDNNATTPIDPRVLESMMPFLKDNFGNASSNHSFGVSINQSVKQARSQVAELIRSDPHEIIFTSGATESINLAFKGLVESNAQKKHIITVCTEHPAVLDTCNYLEGKGYEVTYLPVQPDGLIELDLLKDTIREDTLVVSVMLVNNETGVIQPIAEIADIAHQKGVFFMTDATQAVGKIPIHIDKLGIDLMAFSAHKFYGPKGVGGLFVRSRRPYKVKAIPLIHGGGHERGFRSGTLNVPGIIGLGKASELARFEMDGNKKLIEPLRNKLETELLKMEHTFLNGHKEKRLYNVSNICFVGVDADATMVGLESIMVSNGSACTSTKIEPSHVLKSIGRTDAEAYSSIRFSIGKNNTEREIELTILETKEIVKKLRAIY